MNIDIAMPAKEASDEELVNRCTKGDRDAFATIVTRYQTLVCSLAYNATGNLSQSEDLAQETFVAAWRHLRNLREPSKLRSWLCGITRNHISSNRRSLLREPAHDAADISVATEVRSPEPWPSNEAIAREHQQILWQALERLPELYREPLILFYRQHRSIETVARELGLSEDTVKQRLSRGRKLLHEQVVAFVEGALEQTAPGPAFTLGVMGVLPLIAATGLSTTTAVGTGTIKTGAAASTAKFLLLLNIVIGPLITLAAAWIGIRTSISQTRSPEERRLIKRHFLMIGAGVIAVTIASSAIGALVASRANISPVFPAVIWLVLLMTNLAVTVVLSMRLQQKLKHLSKKPDAPQYGHTDGESLQTTSSYTEYRSRWSLFGLPLIHIRLTPQWGESKPAVGWIAIGNYAFGALFACGGVATGAVSIGSVSIGLVSLGAVSLGFLSLGLLAVGVFAMGGLALGYVATGAFAFGWMAAEGRYAFAREFALGVHASATHANDSAANAYFAHRPWFDLRTTAGKALFSLVWLPFVLVLAGHFIRAQKKKRASQTGSSAVS